MSFHLLSCRFLQIDILGMINKIKLHRSAVFLFSTEDMGFEPTHAVTRLPRFQHGLLSLLSNLPILTQIVYHKATYLAIKMLELTKMIVFERK